MYFHFIDCLDLSSRKAVEITLVYSYYYCYHQRAFTSTSTCPIIVIHIYTSNNIVYGILFASDHNEN